MSTLYAQAKAFGYGLVETYTYIVNRSLESYEAIWDYVIDRESMG